MKPQQKIRTPLLLGFIAIIFAACGGSEETVEVVNVDEITVIFEAENCSYDGPTVIREGELSVFFNNLTDSTVGVRIYKLDDGKTWQDFLDHYSEKNVSISFPSWASIQSHKPDLEDFRVMYFNLEPGTFAMSCGEILEGTVAFWLGSPLEVK